MKLPARFHELVLGATLLCGCAHASRTPTSLVVATSPRLLASLGDSPLTPAPPILSRAVEDVAMKAERPLQGEEDE